MRVTISVEIEDPNSGFKCSKTLSADGGPLFGLALADILTACHPQTVDLEKQLIEAVHFYGMDREHSPEHRRVFDAAASIVEGD